MKNYLSFISGILLTLVVSTPLLADDTEIFIGASPNAGKSNVILSIDTSGSMLGHVTNFEAVTMGVTSSLPSHPKYDPNGNYSTNTTCNTDYVYELQEFQFAPGVPMMPYVAAYRNSTSLTTNVSYNCRSYINGSGNRRYDILSTPGCDSFHTGIW